MIIYNLTICNDDPLPRTGISAWTLNRNDASSDATENAAEMSAASNPEEKIRSEREFFRMEVLEYRELACARKKAYQKNMLVACLRNDGKHPGK